MHRNANVINALTGVIYNITVDIAKSEDGRTILYATKGKIKKVGNVDVHSLISRGAQQKSNSESIVTDSNGESQDKNSYALSEAEDSEYMELAKEPKKNEERLNELVSKAERKAFVRAVADGDIFDLVENATYDTSTKDTKGHKKTDGYTDYFDYYIKTIQIDGKVFDLDVSVKKKYGEESGFTYTLFLTDNKKIKASPAVNTQGALKMEADALQKKDTTSGTESQGKNSYALSEAEDSEYMELAKEPEKNEERLSELVSKAARKAGYNVKAYHGTSSFGFTKFDLTKMDDKRSILI